jgi:hypothetical protein
MRRDYLFAAIAFGALAGYAMAPLPSFAFETADQRARIAEPAATALPFKPHKL